MVRYWYWLKSWFRSLPKVKHDILMHSDGNRSLKVSMIRSLGKGGIIWCAYHNETRKDAWLYRMDRDGNLSQLLKSGAETYGYGDWSDGWLYLPAEHRGGQVLRVHFTGMLERLGHRQPEEYANRCVGSVSSYTGRNDNKNIVWDMATGQEVARIPFGGIASGLIRRGGEWIMAELIKGIASSAGWAIQEGCSDLCEYAGDIYAFMRDGRVCRLEGSKLGKVIARTGAKSMRAVVLDGRLYWATGNTDAVWCYDGRKAKMIYAWDSPAMDPMKSGSLFDVSLDADGKDLIVARSRDKAGYEIRRLVLG